MELTQSVLYQNDISTIVFLFLLLFSTFYFQLYTTQKCLTVSLSCSIASMRLWHRSRNRISIFAFVQSISALLDSKYSWCSIRIIRKTNRQSNISRKCDVCVFELRKHQRFQLFFFQAGASYICMCFKTT